MKRRLSLFCAVVAVGLLGGTATAGTHAKRPVLKATPKVVPYGDAVALSGSAGAGTAVQLLAQPCGFTAPAPTERAKATAAGSYRFALTPAISTVFVVSSDAGKSRAVMVRVRPLVEIKRVAAGRYAVSVSAGAGSFFTGDEVVVQRAVGNRWKTAGHAVLKQASSDTALTAVSGATVKAKAARGTKVRAYLSPGSARPCYAASASEPIAG